jgi:glycosyltransferase involved in cell wall biosynthesis
MAEADSLGIRERVVFAGRIRAEEIDDYLGAMDVCVSTQSNDLVGNVRTTGKLPLYLSHSCYVIATSVGEARKVLPGVGSLLSYEGVKDEQYPERLASEIRRLLMNPECLGVATVGPDVVRRNFLYDDLAKRAQEAIRRLGNYNTDSTAPDPLTKRQSSEPPEQEVSY